MANRGNYKHGICGTRIYRIWQGMKGRCYKETNPKFRRYGGRGITVCDEWLHDPKAFYDWALSNGYRDDLSIDRIDNDKGYSPDNCRWADNITQSLNRTQHPSNTGYVGISKRSDRRKNGYKTRFVARVKRNRVMHNVGSFNTLNEAIRAREAFIKSMGMEVS